MSPEVRVYFFKKSLTEDTLSYRVEMMKKNVGRGWSHIWKKGSCMGVWTCAANLEGIFTKYALKQNARSWWVINVGLMLDILMEVCLLLNRLSIRFQVLILIRVARNLFLLKFIFSLFIYFVEVSGSVIRAMGCQSWFV